MTVADYTGLTPEEFGAVLKAWRRDREGASREAWERTRWECLYAVQPHTTKGLRPEDVLSFPWDGEPEEQQGHNDTKTPELSAEERQRRFEAAKQRYGLK